MKKINLSLIYSSLTNINLIILTVISLIPSSYSQSFLETQRKAARFKASEKIKTATIQELFKSKGLPFPKVEIFIRIFKDEDVLELWARKCGNDKFVLVKSYSICSRSGIAGPKRKRGDGQVPEGCYFITIFNPYSLFYLSLGLNYPNESDRILGENRDLGGDIYIHGNCVTIGCIPITDDAIKELYVICVHAKNSCPGKIPVHIFPLRLTIEGMNVLKKSYKDDKTMIFWGNLQEVFNKFETTREPVNYDIDDKGSYIVK